MYKLDLVSPWRLSTLLLGLTLISACATRPIPGPDNTTPDTRASKLDFPRLIASVEQDHGPVAANRIRYWARLIEENKSHIDSRKLQQTNQFFNKARFISDQEIWQQNDYWATPVEFLIKDAGDCEDFSIAKYITLDLMGVDINKMRITYVKAQFLDQAHMVLSYYPQPGDIPLILDNINQQILPADQRQDLTPVYSFNGNDLWLARSKKEQIKSGNAQQLKPWKQVSKRLYRELHLVPE